MCERRQERRVPMRVAAEVEINRTRQSFSAVTENLSEFGAFLQFHDPVDIGAGDQVTCEFQIGDAGGLPHWGIGRVVRVAGTGAAIELITAGFDPPYSTNRRHALPR
ncbi:MAG TPA: PilZ domain-containing protein [Candidatus Limnocylindrales bacterium]|nr:PilZ domain-containing protein [Candidatus Limnocylindrales bacterium]